VLVVVAMVRWVEGKEVGTAGEVEREGREMKGAKLKGVGCRKVGGGG
jgi:hypothetical protein